MTDVRRAAALFTALTAAGSTLVVACAALLVDLATSAHPEGGVLGDAGVIGVATLLAALPLVVGWRLLTFITRAVVTTRAARRRIAPSRDVDLDGIRVVVVPGAEPTAYCVGLLRPTIVVSEQTLSALDAPAVRAVIAHEAHHARRRDALRLVLARMACHGLVFLPVLKGLLERLETAIELEADRAAVLDQQDVAPLASALLTFEQRRPGIEPRRVDQLLGVPLAPWRSPLWLARSCAAVGVIAAAALGLASATGHAPVQAVLAALGS